MSTTVGINHHMPYFLLGFTISNSVMRKSLTLLIYPIMTTLWSYYSLTGLDMWILLVSNCLENLDAQRLWSSYTLIHLWVNVISLIHITSSCNKLKVSDIKCTSYFTCSEEKNFNSICNLVSQTNLKNRLYGDKHDFYMLIKNHCSLDLDHVEQFVFYQKFAIEIFIFLTLFNNTVPVRSVIIRFNNFQS